MRDWISLKMYEKGLEIPCLEYFQQMLRRQQYKWIVLNRFHFLFLTIYSFLHLYTAAIMLAPTLISIEKILTLDALKVQPFSSAVQTLVDFISVQRCYVQGEKANQDKTNQIKTEQKIKEKIGKAHQLKLIFLAPFDITMGLQFLQKQGYLSASEQVLARRFSPCA